MIGTEVRLEGGDVKNEGICTRNMEMWIIARRITINYIHPRLTREILREMSWRNEMFHVIITLLRGRD